MAIDWDKQEGISNLWLPTDEGQELIGEVTDVYPEGTYGPQWTIKDKDGNEFRTPSHKVLQNRMANIKVGNTVKIVFIGEEPPAIRGNNPTKLYDIFVKKEDAKKD